MESAALKPLQYRKTRQSTRQIMSGLLASVSISTRNRSSWRWRGSCSRAARCFPNPHFKGPSLHWSHSAIPLPPRDAVPIRTLRMCNGLLAEITPRSPRHTRLEAESITRISVLLQLGPSLFVDRKIKTEDLLCHPPPCIPPTAPIANCTFAAAAAIGNQ